MIAKLGTCKYAFQIKSRGLVLGYDLYTSSEIKQGESVVVHILRDGIETHVLTGHFGLVLSGKRARYDMSPISITLPADISKKEVIDAEIYLESDCEFWQPEQT